MNRLLLLTTLLVIPACAASSSAEGAQPGSASHADQADAARVAFRVTGMKKTKSGAT